MEWRKYYLDLLFVPSGILIIAAYHIWLWHKVRNEPHTTIIGTNARGRRQWVASIQKDNERKNILAVQTLRNVVMASTLMASMSIFLCCGVAAILSSTYTIKKPLNDTVYGANGEFIMALKYVTLLIIFIFSFLCQALSIKFTTQVNLLINVSLDQDINIGRASNPSYAAKLLEQGFILNTAGNRLLYTALPVLLWIFGPILVFLCCVAFVFVLYNLDFVSENEMDNRLEKRIHDHHQVTNEDSLMSMA